MILRSLACVTVAAVAALVGCEDGDAPRTVQSREAARHGGSATSGISQGAIEKSLAAAEEYFNADDLPRAEAILLTLIDRAPRESAAHELHGQVLLAKAAQAKQRGDTDDAATLAQQAYERYAIVISLSPNSAGLHHSAGDVAHFAGLTEQALAHYLEACRLDPLQPRHAIFAAQLLAEAERYGEAEEALKSALAIDPDEPYAHASLANIALRRSRFDEALIHIGEAREIRPGDLAFRVIEARIHRLSGNVRQGVALLAGLSSREQASDAVANELAAGYAAIGEHEKAASVWANVYQAGSARLDAWRAALKVAEQFLEADRPDEAERWLAQAQLAATVAGHGTEEALRDLEARLHRAP